MGREGVPRFMGSEIEYGYRLPTNRVGLGLNETELKFRPPIPHVGQFLINGAKLHIDVGFIEYATPACESLDDLVVHELAGEEIVWETYGVPEASSLMTLHKRISAPDSTRSKTASYSAGAHENYSTLVDLWGEGAADTAEDLLVHFATRPIYTGAGQPTRDGYMLAQKIQHIKHEVNHGTTGNNKPLINTRNEPHSEGGRGLRRLHVVNGDANMSLWQLRMKFGPTSLFLHLLEQDIDVSDLRLAHPLLAAKQVAGGVDGIGVSLRLRSGATASAVNIQEELARRMAELLPERMDLSKQEKKVVEGLFAITDALKRYRAGEGDVSLLKKLDWYTKKEILDGYAEKHEGITMQRREQIDLHYDQLPEGLGTRLRQGVDEEKGKGEGRFFSDMPSREAIDRARTTPPPGRSQLLGALVKEGHSRNLLNAHVGWDYFSYLGRKRDLGPVEVRYTEEEIAEKVREFLEDPV